MPRISEDSKAQRREQILLAARRCFAEQGFHQTSMDDVIKTAGLSAGAVYSYFSGKDDLVRAASDGALSRVTDTVREAIAAATRDPGTPVTESFAVLLDAILRFMTSEGVDVSRITIFCWSEALRDESFRSRIEGHYRAIRAELAALAGVWRERGLIRPDSDLDAVAKVLLSTALGFVTQRQLIGDVTVADMTSGLGAFLPHPEQARPAEPA